MEVRVCVLTAKDIPMTLDIEGTCDCYFIGYLTEADVQETDTHYRNQDGRPDFQYRMVFDASWDARHYQSKSKLTLQAYDRDFFKRNDLVGEACIDLAHIMEDVSLTKSPLTLSQQYYS